MVKNITFPIHRLLFPAKDQYAELAKRAQEIPYGSTDEIGDVVWGPYIPCNPGFPIKDFDNLINLEFEGHLFKACPSWDAYLTGLYGDYMQLPPEDQRVTHGMKVWKVDFQEGN